MENEQPQIWLHKFHASLYLNKLHDVAAKKRNLRKTSRDFYMLINENIRDPHSDSAIERGLPRGNRRKFDEIKYIRRGNRPYFSKQHLKAWFIKNYLPTMQPKVRKAA